MKHIPYPEIGQYGSAIRKVLQVSRKTGVDVNGAPVHDLTLPAPTLTYQASVKLHGSNGALCMDFQTGEVWFQSRENIVTVEKDNAGFARFFSDKLDVVKNLAHKASLGFNDCTVAIFGEWCGGSIQKTVALAKLSKRFVIFGVQRGGVWLSRDTVSKLRNEAAGVYNIFDYPTWEIQIDFNKPELAQNEIVKITEAVEAQCPVAKAFGADGIGEGIVLQCVTEGWCNPEFAFKSKGLLHSTTPTKTISPVGVELVANIREFARKTVSENRCRQGIDKLREAHKKLDRTSVGDFIKWVVGDVVKEESDTAKASGIDIAKANAELSKAARDWFFKNELTFF